MSRSRVLLPVVLVMGVAAGVPRAGAQESSFDCLKAATPVEQMICSDPELLRLDTELDDALAEQRRKLSEPQRSQQTAKQHEWMEQRLEQCHIPAKGDVSLKLRWQAAPCLDEAYRARFAALGVTPEQKQPSIPAANESGFIHPNCLWSILEEEPEAVPRADPRIPIEACKRGNRHIPVTEGDEGGFTSQSASDGYFTWLSYKPIGRLRDGREPVIVWYNSGGTAVYSVLYLLRRSPAPDGRDTLLSAELVGEGGDRCNGGIEAAELIDGRKLQVDYRITPQDLLAEGDEELANDTLDALAFCTVCCTGTVRRALDVSSKQETTISATVEELLSDDEGGGSDEEGRSTQACFDGIVRKAAGGPLPHTFTATEVKALAASFAEQCLKN